jgi:cytochrome b6-f complex iron-sulfur subunit
MSQVIHSTPRPLIDRKGLFQVAVFAVIVVLMGLPYIGVALRYLFPARGSSGQSVSYPLAGLQFANGVAGPVTYEFTKGEGDVAGVFIVNNGEQVLGLEQTCTHLGCPVAWNAQAGQFQCPCHGSVFSRTGQVIHGPAPIPLFKHRVELAGDTVIVKGRV